MPNYAVIENGIVVNTVVSDPDYAASQGWIPLPEKVGRGWTFDGTTWDNPNKPTLEELAAKVRDDRDFFISSTDWTQAPDVPQALKDKWAPYRQALRDVPQQPGFPTNVVWPVRPE